MVKPKKSPNKGRFDDIYNLINGNIEQSKNIVNKSKENIEKIIKSMNVNEEELQRVINDLENNNSELIESELKRNKDEDKDDMFAIQTIFYDFLINKWNKMSKQQKAGKRRSSRKKSKKHSRKKSKRRRSRRRSRH